MEIAWKIYQDTGLVRLKYFGEPNYDTWAEVMENIFRHPDYRIGFGFVADLSESGIPDTDHLKLVRQFIVNHKNEFCGTRWANVTDRPAHYGMTRMAQVFVEDLPTQLRIFNSMNEAEAWASGAVTSDDS
jgi:hypothetical protein